jgi:hypothetical protein
MFAILCYIWHLLSSESSCVINLINPYQGGMGIDNVSDFPTFVKGRRQNLQGNRISIWELRLEVLSAWRSKPLPHA